MNILAIGAHPDDIEFGCAHVLIQEARRGHRVKLLVLSRGEAASHGTPESRESEARAAAKIIHAEIDFLDFGGDCHIAPTHENAFAIAAKIREFQPSVVLAPDPNENQHPDHSVAAKLTRDACRYARYAGLENLKPHAPHAVTALYFYTITQTLPDPGIVIDVSDVVQEWEAAMQCHTSQMRTRSYADLRLSAARNLGLSVGVDYAAGFWANDPIRLAALSDLTLSSRYF